MKRHKNIKEPNSLDMTTGCGTQSSLGESLLPREKKAGKNQRKPVNTQPRMEYTPQPNQARSTYQDLMASCNSEGGAIPQSLNRTEQVILSLQNQHAIHQTQAHGDDDEEIKQSHVEDYENEEYDSGSNSKDDKSLLKQDLIQTRGEMELIEYEQQPKETDITHVHQDDSQSQIYKALLNESHEPAANGIGSIQSNLSKHEEENKCRSQNDIIVMTSINNLIFNTQNQSLTSTKLLKVVQASEDNDEVNSDLKFYDEEGLQASVELSKRGRDQKASNFYNVGSVEMVPVQSQEQLKFEVNSNRSDSVKLDDSPRSKNSHRSSKKSNTIQPLIDDRFKTITDGKTGNEQSMCFDKSLLRSSESDSKEEYVPQSSIPFFSNIFKPDYKASPQQRYKREDTSTFAEIGKQFSRKSEVRKSQFQQFSEYNQIEEEEMQPLEKSHSLFEDLMRNRSAMNITQNMKGEFDYTQYISEFNLNLHTIKTKKTNRKKCNPIEPDSNFKTSWDIFGLLLVLYCAVVIPYRVAFNMQSIGGLAIFEFMIDIFFMVDVFINLYTGYYKKGALIMKRRHIMCRYLKTWFILDFISGVPYAWFFDEHFMSQEELEIIRHETVAHHTSQLLRLLKIVRFLRIIRLIRLFKLRRLVNRFEEVFFNDTVSTFMSLLKVFFVVFFIVHWAACLFFYIADIERYNGEPNWLTANNFDMLPSLDQYVASAHWALTTMTTVGYGDICPIGPTEMMFAMFCMIMACGVFAYIIGSLSTIIDHKAGLVVEFKEKIMQINDFMIHNKISTDFRIKVRRYLNYLYDNKKEYKLDEEDVLEMLNDNLRVEATIHLNGKLLNDTPIFKSFEVAFLSQLTFVIKKKIFNIDEHIFDEGDRGDSLYYIQRGSIVLIHRKTATYIKELGCDDFMGECAFFTGEPRKVSARSKNFTDVITLIKQDFISTTTEFPKAFTLFLEMQAQIRQTRDFSKIGVKCYVCDKLGHISIECPDFITLQGNDVRMFRSKDQSSKGGDSHRYHSLEERKMKYLAWKQYKEDSSFEVKQVADEAVEQKIVTMRNSYFDKKFKSQVVNRKSRKSKAYKRRVSKTAFHKIEEQSNEHSDQSSQQRDGYQSSDSHQDDDEPSSNKQNSDLFNSQRSRLQRHSTRPTDQQKAFDSKPRRSFIVLPENDGEQTHRSRRPRNDNSQEKPFEKNNSKRRASQINLKSQMGDDATSNAFHHIKQSGKNNEVRMSSINAIRLGAEQSSDHPINIGKLILEDIGKNKMRRVGGGDFLDMIMNTQELKDQKGRKLKRRSTFRVHDANQPREHKIKTGQMQSDDFMTRVKGLQVRASQQFEEIRSISPFSMAPQVPPLGYQNLRNRANSANTWEEDEEQQR